MDQLANCKQAMFYGFNVYDNVDDAESHHHIHACTACGSDWNRDVKAQSAFSRPAKEQKVNYKIGWWSQSLGFRYQSILSDTFRLADEL
ncbi:hypothetical protein N7449_000560 [Penicillium cf. viridicatum]|uniref:Uncharacterized protein n=1 Tax=Penicillium cf. viridicatum TaxID=2972119 RepID=A0A9W9N595_9EURO|nr:hypothetical protein N7449_000560 [Penicillium cf. viridicatum]